MKNLQGWMILGIACLAGCVGTTIPVQAQQTATAIVVKERLVEHVGDRLIIDMKLALDELSLPANRSLVCTPLIERGDSVRALPPVIVNGRNRQIQYERSKRDATANGEFVLRRHNGKEQTFDYHASIPFVKWMERSEVSLVADFCGCGWEALSNDKSPLFPIRIAEPVVLRPLLAYVTPEAERVKERVKEGSAFLDFPVNRTEIYPEYRDNPSELRKILETVSSVKDDPYATITEVYIKGFASPEGTYKHNTYLAEHRAKALIEYVKGLYHFEQARFTVDFEPEDWAGLEKRVENSSLADKDSISQAAFEVGEEVVKAFQMAGFPMERILRRNAETQKAHIDLWETNRLQLLEAGLLSEHIEIAGICTYIRYEDYFSARRLGVKSGRILTGICLKKS